MKIRLAIVLSSILFCGCKDENNCLHSTGAIIKEERKVGYFSGINVNDNIELILSSDAPQSVVVEAGKNIMDGISTEVINYQLYIKNNNKCNWLRSYDKKIKVYVSQPDLIEIYNLSYGKIYNNSQQVFDSLTIHNYGNGELNMNIKCNKLRIDTNFFGDINLSGAATVIDAHCFRLAKLDTRQVKCQNFKLNCEAEGDIYIASENSLTGTLNNKGNVYFSGNPPIKNLVDSGEGNFIQQ